MKNEIQLNGIYFYSGFSKPKKVAKDALDLVGLLKSNELVISDNYSGDANSEIIELIEIQRHELELLHDNLVTYNLFIDPLVSEFQKINVESYGLDASCYLEGLLK